MSGVFDLDSTGQGSVEDLWEQLEDVTEEFSSVRPRKDRQLNLRVDEGLLSSLREAAIRHGEGYHTFARRLIEEGVAHALEEPAGPEVSQPAHPLRMKEVMLVLLGAADPDQDTPEGVIGRTRLQKLLFLAAQHLQPDVRARFEAYSFGPFDESIEADVDFLAAEGLIEAKGREPLPEILQDDPDRGERILTWVMNRHAAEGQDEDPADTYRLTSSGMAWVHRFIGSETWGRQEAKDRLWDECVELKRRFGRVPLEELVDFVYSEYPDFTTRSKIRHQVAERVARKRE